MKKNYLTEVVPQKLQQLKAEDKALWGSMTVPQMVDHLRRAVLFSFSPEKAEITTPAEKLPLYKRFLMSDKPFGENLPQPSGFNRVPAYPEELEPLKKELLRVIGEMLDFFDARPDFRSVHPSFGELSPQEWLHLHQKHFEHHFRQFGLH